MNYSIDWDGPGEQNRSMCDGCGAVVPLEKLSLATFIEGEGLVCDECKRATVVVGGLDANA